MSFTSKSKEEPSKEKLEGFIKKWEANIAFISLRIKQQAATQVRGRMCQPYEIEEAQAKIDHVKRKYKKILELVD